MNNHPLNLALRFGLEILLLIIFASWGWNKFAGIARYLVAIGLPLIAATAWAVFKVDGDPHKAIIAIPGWLRLIYELLLFTMAAFMLLSLKLDRWAYIFMIVSILHYVVSYDRVVWLLNK